jgi:hypothetical protein
MKPLSDASRLKVRALILGLEWCDETALAGKADQWAVDHESWVRGVKWKQWEGLRRQGERARRWEEYSGALTGWLTDSEKTGESRRGLGPPRRAWDLAPSRPGQDGLRDALLRAIEDASRPPKPNRVEEMLADRGFPSGERTEIDQWLRVQRARRFVDLLVMKVKTVQENPDA